jgi:hypothetical protein
MTYTEKYSEFFQHLRKYVISFIRVFFLKFNLIIIRIKIFESIMRQRDAAIKRLVEIELEKVSPGITCIIFSKDRALQLHALITSFKKHVSVIPKTYVLYSASSLRHQNSYYELEVLHSNNNFFFINEDSNFHEKLLELLLLVSTRSIFFLTDDDIFIRDVELTSLSKIEPLDTILSLRHSPYIKKSYTENCNIKLPVFNKYLLSPPHQLLKFYWFQGTYEWADPWSVNGQVLSTAEVNVLANVSDFKAPNTFEAALKSYNSLCVGRQGVCYPESIILNLPINIVQNEVDNRSGGISTDYLLEQWERGLMIDLKYFDSHIPKSTHEEHPLCFITR